jgi:hypothetical protein
MVRQMAEHKWSIPTTDGKIIYGLLNKSEKKSNHKAVLHIHGLTGHPYEVAQTMMAGTFPDNGYDVIRPYLYHGPDDARKLVDCTLAIHAKDVMTITQHFKTLYDDVYVIGHSYGGPSIMLSDTSLFAAICLWDPTYDPNYVFRINGELPQLGDYRMLIGSGTYRLMGEAMYQESATIDMENCRALSRSCTTPLQVITAGNSMWAKKNESYHTHAAGISNGIIIPNTVHCFYEEGTTSPLLQYTQNWFDQF